ncbi:syntaxin-61-like isoform X4 [Musa acuminata AAA Group]|uniref:syntaxin-61-like isoform X4 n=1 Tax=Musa acuminata AAA Group TaxID=214697 RepID=UPI0031DEB3A2
MTPAQDPFYVVKEEIQESINKLQVTFQQWEQTPSNTGESVHLTKQLVVSCESIEWQVDELDMAIAVAVRDPAWYGLDEVELEKHRRWTSTARYQAGRSNNYINQDNDDFISSESVQQLLLIKKQDEELDELSASVRRIGDVGLTIHDELVGQGKLLDEFGMEMETTSNRLDFVQKKVAKVMKKAGAKGQIMMIAFLIILFIILLFLVFFT